MVLTTYGIISSDLAKSDAEDLSGAGTASVTAGDLRTKHLLRGKLVISLKAIKTARVPVHLYVHTVDGLMLSIDRFMLLIDA